MRNVVSLGLYSVAIATLSLACASEPQQPISNPKPQQAVIDPKPQAANDPLTGNHNPSQPPISDPKVHEPRFGGGGPQEAVNDPSPQKPFYPPGTSGAVLAKTDKPMSDAEVLGVVMAVNDGEVQMAEQATKKGASADVKQFASMMKTHHTAGLTKTKTVATKTKITSADSDLSSFLKTDTGNMLKDLGTKEGKEFDKTYMDGQVKMHKDVLTAIDNRLLPGATNGEVKALLNETRTTVSQHITKAEEIQKKMEKTASTEPASTPATDSKAKGLQARP